MDDCPTKRGAKLNIEALKTLFFHNTVGDYLLSLGIAAFGALAIKIAHRVVLARVEAWAKKTATELDDFIVDQLERNLLPLLYYGVLQVSLTHLTLLPWVTKALNFLGISLLTFFSIRFLAALSEYALQQYWAVRQAPFAAFPRAISSLIKGSLWGFGILFLLDNLGFRISTVVAGLGIGGVAVALASQAVLGDLFCYFIILFDRPFDLGDFLIVDEYLGTVEYIGIKSTRLRSLTGEQLVFSNRDLTNSRLRNYKRMQERRAIFQFGVIYETPLAKLTQIPTMVQEIISSLPGTRFDRAHLKSFGPSSLDFEVVYYVLNADYNSYMDFQQQINLKLIERFAKENIDFAYPTQLLYLKQETVS